MNGGEAEHQIIEPTQKTNSKKRTGEDE